MRNMFSAVSVRENIPHKTEVTATLPN
jgi:hypothetical protein